MTEISQSSNFGQRQTWGWVFAVLGIYWLALIYQLGAQWSVYDQYNYGWAVPFLCAFLAWQRLKRSEVRSQKSEVRSPPLVFYMLLVICAALYAPTRFFHEANPIWRLTSLLWTIEVITITLCLLRFMLHGSRFKDFVFPVCFFLVAVPWPSGVESFLVQTFTRLNVSATTELLGWFGIPALQHGNVIEVATGEVGIDEACSGIRSFQATLMISLFFGEFYRLNPMRRAACVLAGFALSFLFNMARTTLLTWVAAKQGVAAITGWHDPAGVTILVACFVALWLVALWLRRNRPKPADRGQRVEAGSREKEVGDQKSETGSTSPRPSSRREEGALPSSFHPKLSTVRQLAAALLVWFVVVEAGTQFWFRLHENSTAAVREDWSVNVDGTKVSLTKIEIPPDIRAQFRADNETEVRWRDSAGNSWQLYYFRWLPARSLNQRVAVQLAKTHGPEKCLPAVGMTLKSDLGTIAMPVGDMQFAFRQYLFLAGDQPLYVFYAIYEDQTGNAVLANRRQNVASRIAAALAGSRNDGQRFFEIAVAGPENPDQAKAALGEELGKLIVSHK